MPDQPEQTGDVFAHIARGETQAHVVLETERVMAILDINPAREGHTILFPKEPYQVLGQIPPDLRAELFAALRVLRHATAKQDPSIAGLTSIINQGAAAGQRAPRLLIHTIPRQREDSLFPEPNSASESNARAKLEPLLPGIAPGDQNLEVSIGDPGFSQADLIVRDRSVDLFEELDATRIATFAEAVSLASTLIFETLGAEGTTIMIESGASQDELGALARIVPRWNDDGLELLWKPGPAGDLRAVSQRFASTIARADRDVGDQAAREQQAPVIEARERAGDHEERAETRRNYLIEQLKRLP